ncbi:MAG TPA: hypothetical protein VMO26_23070 [Vicinamibacterales bacterium]|nr:hypothetical protein [Vicinamibacterales bacterium]
MRRIAGVVLRPRATLAALVSAPTWLGTWSAILIVWAVCGGWLLTTDIGQQALVDERVRVIETFGGSVTDAQYASLQAEPPWWVYFTSGSRLLLLPITTLLVAVGLLAVARLDGVPATLLQALALVVHATVILLVGQLVGTPVHFVREALTSPLNLASLLPLVEDGTLAARFFGTMDVFAVWWAALLALSLSVLTGRRFWRYAGPLAALYLGFAALAAATIAAMGGA